MGFILKNNTNFLDISRYGLTVILQPKFFISPFDYDHEQIAIAMLERILKKVEYSIDSKIIPSSVFIAVGTFLFENRNQNYDMVEAVRIKDYFK